MREDEDGQFCSIRESSPREALAATKVPKGVWSRAFWPALPIFLG
jgi:hypothetical protein